METLLKTKSGRKYQRVAWTGGSWKPEGLEKISKDYRDLVSFFFREQMMDFGNFWGDLPDMDTRRIFWRRAKADAYATYREAMLTPKKNK